MHRPTFSTLLLLPMLAGPVVAQDTPKPQYTLREEEPLVGTRLRRDQVHGSKVAVNLPYDQLPPADKEALHAWWESIPPGDEPPFPAQGLAAVYDPLRKAHEVLSQPGKLFVVATVGADGTVIDARVYEAPSQKMARFAAQLLLLTKFKPAICSGQPCRMDFPLQMTFRVTSG
jgi:hypothetical protein